MNGVGYVLAAYVGAVALYGGYVVFLLRRERKLKGTLNRDRRSDG
jgi:hypothetical protein